MITTNLNKKEKYPYLGISGDHLVLFTEKDTGFSFKENMFYNQWAEENFTPYNEPLTIQNEV